MSLLSGGGGVELALELMSIWIFMNSYLTYIQSITAYSAGSSARLCTVLPSDRADDKWKACMLWIKIGKMNIDLYTKWLGCGVILTLRPVVKVSLVRDQSRFIKMHYNSLFLSLIMILLIIISPTPLIEDRPKCPVTIDQDNCKKTHKNIKDKNLV